MSHTCDMFTIHGWALLPIYAILPIQAGVGSYISLPKGKVITTLDLNCNWWKNRAKATNLKNKWSDWLWEQGLWEYSNEMGWYECDIWVRLHNIGSRAQPCIVNMSHVSLLYWLVNLKWANKTIPDTSNLEETTIWYSERETNHNPFSNLPKRPQRVQYQD